MDSFHVVRLSRQAAAAAFIRKYTENSEEMFKELANALQTLPELGEKQFRRSHQDFLITYRIAERFFKGFSSGPGNGTDMHNAVEAAVQAWVLEALTVEGTREKEADVRVTVKVQGGAQYLKVIVEYPLF